MATCHRSSIGNRRLKRCQVHVPYHDETEPNLSFTRSRTSIASWRYLLPNVQSSSLPRSLRHFNNEQFNDNRIRQTHIATYHYKWYHYRNGRRLQIQCRLHLASDCSADSLITSWLRLIYQIVCQLKSVGP